ncbi:hypothetical protein, partial [Salmonella enterica]|uniref:hypothetical protein n=1 Tax=Salmonella enterica TaxID=28901 RepID=UPI00398C55BE
MSDPKTAVCFTTFGASTLEHELRLYVRDFRDRSHTLVSLTRAIDPPCGETDIDIAFHQIEVLLNNAKWDDSYAATPVHQGCHLAPQSTYTR